MKKAKIIVIIGSKGYTYHKMAETVISNFPNTSLDSFVASDRDFSRSKAKSCIVISIGKNRLNSQFLQKNELSRCGSDGYILRGFSPSWCRCLVVACGNSQRSNWYAAWDLIDSISEKNGSVENLITLDKVEIPAFEARRLVRFLPGFGLLDPKAVVDREFQTDMECEAIDSLRRRVNLVQVRHMGMDNVVDFEEIGFPEVYGDDRRLKGQRQKAILEHQSKMRNLISIHHKYGLKVGIWSTWIGFCDQWVNENFFKVYPEARAKLGREVLSINWASGIKNRWCPSHPVTWKFVRAYLREYFRKLDVDEFTTYEGDCFGTLYCACKKCREFPYVDRVRKLAATIHQIMKEERPGSTYIHDCNNFAQHYNAKQFDRNTAVEMEKRVLKGLDGAQIDMHWAVPMCYDNCHAWREIYHHPFLHWNNLNLRTGFEWHLHPVDRFAVQCPQVEKEQLIYAVLMGVKGIRYNYMRDMDAFFWMKWTPQCLDPLVYDHRTHNGKKLMPWHLDAEAEMKCVWNPIAFDVEQFWMKWCNRHFGKAGDYVYQAFRPSVAILDTLSRWDIGDFAGGGLPPFSYLDRIFNNDNVKEIAHQMRVGIGIIEKQARYPHDPAFYDVTDKSWEMVRCMKKAVQINPRDQTLKEWLGYAKGTYYLSMAFKFYHEGYFLKGRGDTKSSLASLEKGLKAVRYYNLEDYWISCKTTLEVKRFYIQAFESQIQQLKKGKQKPFNVKEYAKVIPPAV